MQNLYIDYFRNKYFKLWFWFLRLFEKKNENDYRKAIFSHFSFFGPLISPPWDENFLTNTIKCKLYIHIITKMYTSNSCQLLVRYSKNPLGKLLITNIEEKVCFFFLQFFAFMGHPTPLYNNIFVTHIVNHNPCSYMILKM